MPKTHPLLSLTLIVALLCLPAAGCRAQQPSGAATQEPVPEEYEPLYSELGQNLDQFTQLMTVQQGIGSKPLVFGAELLPANANRGEDLLAEHTLQGVEVYLDQLQRLGVGGVKVSIAYPLLQPDFPRSAEYLAFYKQVAVLVRQRNLQLLVGVGVVFRDPTFSSLRVDYRGLTLQSYAQGLQQHVRTILEEIQPNYLTVINEPDTLSANLGLSIDLANYQTLLESVLSDLRRGSTLIGAGAGNWNDTAYIEYVAHQPLIDYIDMHIYPVRRDNLVRLFEFAELSRQNDKHLVIGEAWLYKAGSSELVSASAAEIISRDVFSFWQPLDTRFIKQLVQFARQNRVVFMSVFWSNYFFAYLAYPTDPADLSPGQLLQQADQAAVPNILSGSLTLSGTTYQQLIKK